MRSHKLIVGITIILCALLTQQSIAQGDQILDGIGETDLISRYTFKGDFKDWSRNNIHASIHGTDYKFVDDDFFGKVLSISGADGTYISIPGEAMKGEESISITGWIFMRSSTNLTPYKWNHFSIIFNIPTGNSKAYLNGKHISNNAEAVVEIEQILNFKSGLDIIQIGKSLKHDESYLNAKLHELRIYRIPLSEEQINRILHNSFSGESGGVRTRKEKDPNLPVFSELNPQLFTPWLRSIPKIYVETELGKLPYLPRFVKGIYSDEIAGPEVRVIWPAPKDNSQVLIAGTYSVTGSVAGTDIQPIAIITVKDSGLSKLPEHNLESFDLDQVSLDTDIHGNKTKFIENRDKFISVLSNTNPDNFLYMFRNAFGQVQPEGAEPLGVWDSQETKLRGHATGHYMSALAQAYASTSYNKSLQANFAQKMKYMVNTLYDLSQLSGRARNSGGDHVSDPLAVTPGPGKVEFDSDLSVDGIRTDYWNWGTGFISAYPPDQFIMLENGAKYGGDDAKVWAPYYTLHKILAGLMDIYEISGNWKALETVKGMGTWVHTRLSQVPAPTLISMWNTYIAGEFGGMNEAMARLYRLTGEKEYLETAKLFDNIRVFFGDAKHSHGLAKNVDMFRGLHANQHIPQIMGALEYYRVSNTPEYFQIADNFWKIVVNDYMYSIGGVAGARNPSNAECFTEEPASLYENGFSAGGQNETCCTYNMLKLSRNLFMYDQRGEIMDYYERGLYNHILASVDEHTPANTYHVPLRAGSVKRFGNPDMKGFTCCNGTALESSTKLQNSIYFKSEDNKALFVNLYVPSTLKWKENNIIITQSTAFPKEDYTILTIGGKGKFDLNVRVPKWAEKGFFVKINGKEQKVEAIPGSYMTISRKWKNGDKVELQMPFSFRLEPVMDQQNIASLFYGPVLLAAQESKPRNEWQKLTLNAKNIGKSISGDPKKLEFTIDGITFKPFFETYGRYSVYLDVTLKDAGTILIGSTQPGKPESNKF